MVSVLSNRVFRHLYAAQVIALLGTGLATVALGLLAYDLAGMSAGAVVGTLLAIKMAANVLIAPIVTAFADRLPRRAFLVSMDAVRAGVALGLPFVGAVWQVFALVIVLQVASAAFTPTFQAVIPTVLPEERDYTRGLSLSRLAYDLEGLLSPVLAGALLTVMGFSWLFIGTAVGFAASAALVLSVALPTTERAARRGGAYARTIRGTWIYLATPRLRAQLGLNLAAAAAGSMVLVNTVVLVRGDLGFGDSAVAVALGAFGGGSMLAALLLPRVLDRTGDRAVMIAAAGALSGLLVALGVVHAAAPAARWVALLLGWALLGVAYSLVLTPVGRLIRRSAHPADYPVLFAAQFALSHAGWLLTYLLAGLLGEAIGAAATMLVLGAIAAGGCVYGTRTWSRHDSADIEHVHHDLDHDHDHPHLTDARPTHRGWRHAHHYVIDDSHRRWPADTALR